MNQFSKLHINVPWGQTALTIFDVNLVPTDIVGEGRRVRSDHYGPTAGKHLLQLAGSICLGCILCLSFTLNLTYVRTTLNIFKIQATIYIQFNLSKFMWLKKIQEWTECSP